MGVIRNIQTAINWCIYLPIVGITWLIVWLDRKIQFSLPFPRHLAQLAEQQDWCIAELKKGNALPADAVIQQYKITPLNQDAIFRSNAGRIEIGYATGGENKTLKCFAKFAPLMGTVWNKAVFNFQLNHSFKIAITTPAKLTKPLVTPTISAVLELFFSDRLGTTSSLPGFTLG